MMDNVPSLLLVQGVLSVKKSACLNDSWASTEMEKSLWAPHLSVRMVQELCVGVLACKNCCSANQVVPVEGLLGLTRMGHVCCLLLRGGGTCPCVACSTQTTFLPRVLLHIVSKCHEEGLDHYLRSFIKVSHDTVPLQPPCWQQALPDPAALLASVRVPS